MNHLDPSTLTDLGQAIEWDHGTLEHAASCSECRERFAELASLAGTWRPADAVRAGFADTVLHSLAPAGGGPEPAPSGLGWRLVLSGLGAAVAVVTLGLAAGGGTPLPANLATAGVVAAIGAVGGWRLPRIFPAT